MFLSCILHETHTNAAIIITAGTHPTGMNGFRFITREGESNAAQLKKLIEAAAVTKLTDPPVSRIDLQDIYVERLKTVHNAWFMLRMSVHDPVMPLNAESGVRRMLGDLYDLLKDVGGLDLAPLEDALKV